MVTFRPKPYLYHFTLNLITSYPQNRGDLAIVLNEKRLSPKCIASSLYINKRLRLGFIFQNHLVAAQDHLHGDHIPASNQKIVFLLPSFLAPICE